MTKDRIPHQRPTVNSIAKTTLDLSGMELSPFKENLRDRWRAANPNPTPRDIARREVLLSNMSSDAKLFAVAVIEIGGLECPVGFPRSEALILLSKSKDGFSSAAKKFGEWVHAKVDEGGSGKKHRYSILKKVLDLPEEKRPAPQAGLEKAACSSGRFGNSEPACPTGQSPEKRPAPQAGPIGPIIENAGALLSQFIAAVAADDVPCGPSTPNEGNGSDGQTPRPQTLESPNPDLSKPDLMRANPDSHTRLSVHDLHNRLVSACNGALARGSMALELVVEPKKWIAAGCDLEQDILPVLAAVSKRTEEREGPGTIKGWRYFEGPVMKAMRDRTRPIDISRGKDYTGNPPNDGDGLMARLEIIQRRIQNGERA